MTKPILPQEVIVDNSTRLLGDPSDALRDLLAGALNAVMHQEAAARLNAGMYERHDDREGYRNGTRPRNFDTRMGTLELDVPRIRGAWSDITLKIAGQRAQ